MGKLDRHQAMTREEYMALTDAELWQLQHEEYGDVARRADRDDD